MYFSKIGSWGNKARRIIRCRLKASAMVGSLSHASSRYEDKKGHRFWFMYATYRMIAEIGGEEILHFAVKTLAEAC